MTANEGDGVRIGAAGEKPLLPDTSLIICTRNRSAMLSDTMESILRGNELPGEIIIVDQSDEPHPSLSDLPAFGGCRIVYHRTASTGLSRAINIGIALARHELLAFTHDDVRVSADWFGVLVRSTFEAGPGTVVTGRVLPERGAAGGGFVPSTKVDEERRVYEGRIGEGVLYPMTMALFRSAFDDVGFFDERLGPGTPFPAAEDNDMCHRLLEAGYRVLYEPRAVLEHRAWRASEEFLPLRWSYGRGQGAFYAKHLSLADRFWLRQMGWEIQHRLRKMSRRVLSTPREAWGEVVYLAGIVAGAGSWFLRVRSKR